MCKSFNTLYKKLQVGPWCCKGLGYHSIFALRSPGIEAFQAILSEEKIHKKAIDIIVALTFMLYTRFCESLLLKETK